MATDHAPLTIKKQGKHHDLEMPQVPPSYAEGGDAPPSALESYAGGVENMGYGQERISIDIPIPSDKVGLIIGKGGKTIKYFQEKCGAKMHIIQQTTSADEQDKVLRIMGPIPFVEHGRQMVHDLVCQSKDLKLDPLQTPTAPKTSGVDGPPTAEPAYHWKTVHYSVPKTAVGLIIGKGGETIRRIRTQTGARIRFQPGPKVPDGPPETPDSIAVITGKEENIHRACEQIDNLIALSARGAGGPSGGQLVTVDLDPSGTFDEIDPPSKPERPLGESTPLLPPIEHHGQGDLKYPHMVPSQQQVHDLLSSAVPITSFPVLADPSQMNLLQAPPTTITQFPLGGLPSGIPNWLEYFTPERQQANADAWDQQVKAEQEECHQYCSEDTQVCQETIKEDTTADHCCAHGEVQTTDSTSSMSPAAPLQWSTEAECNEYEQQQQVQANAAAGDGAPPASHSYTCLPTTEVKTIHPAGGMVPHPVFVPVPLEHHMQAYHPSPLGEPAMALGGRPSGTSFLYPVASHAARIITFYYDPNTNSITVLNQWPCA